MITLVLPLPPSDNNAYVNVPKRGRVKSQRYRDWEADAGFYLMQQTVPKGTIVGAYTLEIKVPEKMRGDVRGRIKLPEDLLVNLGVTPDDRFAFKVSCERSHDVEAGDCHVTVRGIKTAEAA